MLGTMLDTVSLLILITAKPGVFPILEMWSEAERTVQMHILVSS